MAFIWILNALLHEVYSYIYIGLLLHMLALYSYVHVNENKDFV